MRIIACVLESFSTSLDNLFKIKLCTQYSLVLKGSCGKNMLTGSSHALMPYYVS